MPPAAAGEGEPLVYVSFGSVTAGGHLPFYPALYRAAIEALAPLPARFLLTVGEERDHAELGALPPNVTVERWVPQDEVLPRAAAVVTHGGLGSTLGALAHGVPLVVLPLFSLDQWFNAAAVARAGAGVALDAERHTRRAVDLPDAATLAALRPAVEHVLTTRSPAGGTGDRRRDPRACRPWRRRFPRSKRSRRPPRLSRPSSTIGSPSAVRRPPCRRSQIMSQCTADSFVPPVSA